MLTHAVSIPALPARSAADPKWDGFRAALPDDGNQVVLRSRRSTQMASSSPEIVAGGAQLPDSTTLDGELIVWSAGGRLAFEQLQNRLHRRGPSAVRAAAQQPAHFVAFNVLRLAGTALCAAPGGT
ncbi:hypothetical protein [Streptomyces ortus]|uniref:ATP-dependent DNA ligase family profile domain-containing protein n=1 Tax=Streptomyces ortus TaxID=2867268 RepID=A0ABT3UVY3_9ACTN|nr:hypothetical protein [Streptomyces ortus]MCX4231730.1 hypothetical protein [Streptomyces ortus]